MINAISPLAEISAASRRIAHGLLNVGENRVELLVVEVQEACERLLRTLLWSLGAVVFALLAGLSVTAIYVVLTWGFSPLLALGVPAILHTGAAVFCYLKFSRLRQRWQIFATTIDELRKDRECLENALR